MMSRRVRRQAGYLKPFKVALGAELRGLAGLVGLVADGGDPLPAEPGQVRHHRAGRGDIVDRDVVERAVVDPLAEQHDGRTPRRPRQGPRASPSGLKIEPVE